MTASSAVAVGAFDGLHLGHRAILERALARVRERGGRCVVVCFDPHPDVVLSKTEFRIPPPLTPIPEKRARLRALGVDELRIIPFTRELAALSPEAFVEDYLVRPLALHTLVVGQGFALGRGRAGNVERLRAIGARHGFAVEETPLLEVDGAPVSSTRIRTLLGEGRVREAAALLGRPYDLAGVVVTGDGIGRTLGFPTANLRLHDEKLLPADGIYAVWVRLPGETEPRPGAMSIGMRPTFDGTVRALEVHVMEWRGDLVGRDVGVEFVDWVRPQQKFEGPEALTAAIAADVAEVGRRLAARRPRRGIEEGVP